MRIWSYSSRMQPEGTIKQRIKRVHEEKPGKVTINDLLAVVPSRREQNTLYFLFAVIRLTFMWPLDSKEAADIADYMTRRGRFAPGYVHAAILHHCVLSTQAMICEQDATCCCAHVCADRAMALSTQGCAALTAAAEVRRATWCMARRRRRQ